MEHKERDAIGVENASKLLSAFTFFVMQSADLVSHLCYTLCSFRRCRNDAVPWAALSSDVLMIAGALVRWCAGALGVRRDDVDQEGFCATRAKAKTARRTHSGRLPGYHRQAVESQMLHKDLLWTTTGAPADFSEMMVARVLRMAAAIHEAERQEVKDLVDARARDQFRADVAPRCISADMVGSLKNFMVAVVNNKLPDSRYVLPSTAMLKQVSDVHERYCQAFGRAWGS